jgi:hypothetical protein
MSEKARSAAKAKVSRLVAPNKGDIDASGWREPIDEEGTVQTGPRPISRRQFKSGGKVSGEVASLRADRKPRKAGGSNFADAIANTDIKEANKDRAGQKHIGGFKSGGHVSGCKCPACCSGGRVGKKAGGALSGGTRPEGGRLARASGGRSKKGMNVNIIIAPSGGGAKPPMPGAPMPPPGALGMHQGMPPGAPMPPPGAGAPMGPATAMPPPGPPMPMARKHGGRTNYPIDTGGGGGLARLEKIKAYG